MNTNKLLNLVLFVGTISLMGCFDTSSDIYSGSSNISVGNPFPTLPKEGSSPVTLNGAMTWWFWEGDGGCFGEISDGKNVIELWSNADLCEPINYEEGAPASIDVIFNYENQYSPNKKPMYTVIKFNK